MFYEKKLQKTNETEFKIEKLIKRKGDSIYMSNRVTMINHLIVGLIK